MVPSAASDYIAFPSGFSGLSDWYQKFAGRDVTVGIWILTSTASHVRIDIYDGSTSTYSDYHTGSGSWEWIEITKTCSASATAFRILVRLEQSSGIAYISQPMLVFGSCIGEGNYSQKPNETVYLEDDFWLTNYNGDDTVSSETAINLEAQSEGKVPKGCKAVQVFLQGSCANPEKYLLVAESTSTANISTLLYSQVANVINTNTGWQMCDSNGDIAIYRNDTFNEVGIKISVIRLR